MSGNQFLVFILGMFSPTKGEIWKDGKNVFDDFESFQRNLGLCPQHDLLFPYLNVIEHVMFFGMVYYYFIELFEIGL